MKINKVMTQEEKAKAYDEALERAKKLQETCDSTAVVGWCEYILPELKESKDEKTRKALISFLKSPFVNENITDEHVAPWLAWLENIPYTIDHEKREGFYLGYKAGLEKQSESYTKKDVDDAYVEGMAFAKDELEKQGNSPIKWNKNTEGNKPQVNHSVLMKTFQGIAEGEWKGEYWLQYRWAGIVRDSDVLSWIELSDLDKQGEQKQKQYDIDVLEKHITKDSISELAHTVIVRNGWEIVDAKEQKPAWSEKDREMIDETLYFIREYQQSNRCKDENGMQNSVTCEKWLKSLKERVGGEQ